MDLILRDIKRVEQIMKDTEHGIVTANYQTGHPHGYISAMYRGELAISKILYAKNESLCELKKQAETYPNALQKSLVNFFMFEAGFSLMFVKAVIMQNFVVSFAVDAIIGCVCFVILMRNYPIRYRVYKLYMEENQFLKLDVSSAIFCFLMKILLPAFIDISMIVLIANYFITVRKKFKNVLKNC